MPKTLSSTLTTNSLPQHELVQIFAYALKVDEQNIRKKLAIGSGFENFTLSPLTKYKISRIIERRKNGQPLQLLLHRAYFYGYEFSVRRGVFIPRPETEVLVERAVDECIKLAKSNNHQSSSKPPLRVLDLCCGSGAIGISIAYQLMKQGIACEVDLIDINKKAVKIAKKNAKEVAKQLESQAKLPVSPTINTQKANAIAFLRACKEAKYDIIVCNPPYVPSIAELKLDGITLSPEVLQDPHNALFGGGNQGFGIPSQIIENCANALKLNGTLFLEHYDTHAKLANDALLSTKSFTDISSFADLNGILRFTSARRR